MEFRVESKKPVKNISRKDLSNARVIRTPDPIRVGSTMANDHPAVQGVFGRLFGTAIGRVLDVLILHRGNDLSQNELAEYAGVSAKTLNKILPRLSQFHLIKESRRIDHARMVTIDLSSDSLTEHLIACEFKLSLKEADN